MGFFDGSESSTTEIDQSSKNAFGDVSDGSVITSLNGVNIGDRTRSIITLTDNGATKAAFDFAGNQSSQAYDYSRDLSKSTASTVAAAVSAVSESARSETENILINLQKYALYGGIVFGAVMIFRAMK